MEIPWFNYYIQIIMYSFKNHIHTTKTEQTKQKIKKIILLI